jgi:hypothetical protein
VVVPVKSQSPDRVDLLVVTRDIWSLRMNSQFEVQDNVLTLLSISLSENNVFGLRKQAAFVFDMDLGQFSLGPQYIDKNIAGTRLQLQTRWSALFSRATSEFEGTSSTTIFTYPLWSLRSKWGASIVATHFDSTVRQFLGPDLRLYDNPDTLELELIPRTFDFRVIGIETSGVRSFGDAVKHRLTAGHTLSIRRPSLLDDFGEQGIALPTKERVEIARAAFERDVMPRSERVSALFVRYNVFTPEFIVYRNLDSYDLPEDARLGPEASIELSRLPGSRRGGRLDVRPGSRWLDRSGHQRQRPDPGEQFSRRQCRCFGPIRDTAVCRCSPACRPRRLRASDRSARAASWPFACAAICPSRSVWSSESPRAAAS